MVVVVVLVVGATGQLGGLVVEELRARGADVRAAVRPRRVAARDPVVRGLESVGAQVVVADLREQAGWADALDGARGVVCTANAVAPAERGDTHAALRRGCGELVQRAEAAGVRRFAYASSTAGPGDQAVPEMALKRAVEAALGASALSWVSVRMPPFVEVWGALLGSGLPLRGERQPTLDRPQPFLRGFRRATGSLVDRAGVALVPGRADRRHAFLSVHDAARLLAGAVLDDGPDAVTGVVDVQGPELISWRRLADLLGAALGRRVRVVSTPAPVFAVGQAVLAPVAPAAAGILGLNRYAATGGDAGDAGDAGDGSDRAAARAARSEEVARRWGAWPLRTAEEVLLAKAALPRA